MSWDHGTFGWDAYDGFVRALRLTGIKFLETSHGPRRSVGYDVGGDTRQLRQVTFVRTDGVEMTCLEYLKTDDGDCDGHSEVAIEVFRTTDPLELWTTVYEGGHERYGLTDYGPDFQYNWRTGEARPLPEDVAV